VTQLNQEQYGLMRSVGAPLRNPWCRSWIRHSECSLAPAIWGHV